VPGPYPREFRDDVVRVARYRDDGVTIEQIAADFGVHPMTLTKWMRQADVDEGTNPRTSTTDSAELRDARRRIKLLDRRTSWTAAAGTAERNCGSRSSPGSNAPTTVADVRPLSGG
jgi:transposase